MNEELCKRGKERDIIIQNSEFRRKQKVYRTKTIFLKLSSIQPYKLSFL